MYKNILAIMFILFLLISCADSSNRGDVTDRRYKQDLHVNNSSSGNVYVYFPVTGASDQVTDTDQETKNSATVSPETSASLAQAGATSQAAVGKTIEPT